MNFSSCTAKIAAAISIAALLYSSVPATASSEFVAKAPKPGFGALYIGRPFGWNTSVFSLPIEINGKALISLGPNEYTRIELRPGRYTIVVPNTFWTRAISGLPHPAHVNIRAGRSYYLLPSRWAGKSHTTYTIIGTVVVPEQTAQAHASFSVQSGAPPRSFRGLTYATPQR